MLVMRKIHLWASMILAPIILWLILTGIFLQVRQMAGFEWIQPVTAKGSERYKPTLPLSGYLETVKKIPTMRVDDWNHVQMIDLRARSGIAKVRTWAEMETQVDAATGAAIQTNQRLNDIVSTWHDGSAWGLRLLVGLPVALTILVLTFAGIWLAVSVIRTKLAERRAGYTPPQERGFKAWCWRQHWWIALIVLIPWSIVAVTGLVLQVRNEIPWIQAPRAMGRAPLAAEPQISFVRVYDIARTEPRLGIAEWKDVWRIYYYPDRGVYSVMVRKGMHPMEAQIDANDGRIIDVTQRGKDLMEDLHEGRFDALGLGAPLNYWVFLPVHVLSLLLWLTGVIMGIQKIFQGTSSPHAPEDRHALGSRARIKPTV